jgi:hypothetical protein
MKPLVKTSGIPYSELMKLADDLLAKPTEWFELFIGPKPTEDQIASFAQKSINEQMEDETCVNDIYQVAVRPADRLQERIHRQTWSISRLSKLIASL